MKKFIAIITLVSMLSCVSCSEKTENSSVASSSSSKIESSSVAESSEEESSEEESGSVDSVKDEEYIDYNGLHIYFPTKNSYEGSVVSSSCGYSVWHQYNGDYERGYSMAFLGGFSDQPAISSEEAIEKFWEYPVEQMLSEVYASIYINERIPEKTEIVKVLDKDFTRESGTLSVSSTRRDDFKISYVFYVGTPEVSDPMYATAPVMWIAFSDDEADKDFIAEMADRAANDLEYTK